MVEHLALLCFGVLRSTYIHTYCYLKFIFVLCMESLSQLIHSKVIGKLWKLVVLRKNGPPIFHLFFADDLFLFADVELDQARVIQEVLSVLGKASGHRVNEQKTIVYFSTNIDAVNVVNICNILHFSLSEDLGTYLGLPLFHRRVTKSTFSFFVDKVRRKLSNWNASSLSLVGRITLAQSVLLSIPNFFMQTIKIPLGICDEIEKITRAFIWGCTSSNKKVPLVKWKDCCQPLANGGIGLRRLREQNGSFFFFVKLGFNLLTNKNSLWVNVLW